MEFSYTSSAQKLPPKYCMPKLLKHESTRFHKSGIRKIPRMESYGDRKSSACKIQLRLFPKSHKMRKKKLKNCVCFSLHAACVQLRYPKDIFYGRVEIIYRHLIQRNSTPNQRYLKQYFRLSTFWLPSSFSGRFISATVRTVWRVSVEMMWLSKASIRYLLYVTKILHQRHPCGTHDLFFVEEGTTRLFDRNRISLLTLQYSVLFSPNKTTDSTA